MSEAYLSFQAIKQFAVENADLVVYQHKTKFFFNLEIN
jgi:hypothetical protein